MTDENILVNVGAERAQGEQSLQAARALLGLGLLNDAVSRAYYAAFHFARALLLTEGIDPRTHGGVSSLLGRHFVITGRLHANLAKELSRLEQFRTEADYNRFFVVTADGAADDVAAAERFCAAVGKLLDASRAS